MRVKFLRWICCLLRVDVLDLVETDPYTEYMARQGITWKEGSSVKITRGG